MSETVIIYKRLQFECWQCGKVYSILKKADLEQKLQVSCPFCNAKADVDFRPFHKRKIDVLRSREKGPVFGDYELPKVLKTNKLDK